MAYPCLPPFLVDQVIDHLKDDRKALAVCSLVSREWVQRSYYHLFEKLVVSAASSKRIVAFEPNNTLSYIRTMMIIGHWYEPEMLRALAILRAHSAPPTLIIQSANLTSNASKSITASLPISAVDTLRLAYCNVVKPTVIFDILSALPRLNHLILHHVLRRQGRSFTAPPSQKYTLRNPPQLSTIEVASASIAPYLELLELVAPQLKLRSLNLGVLHIPAIRRVGKFVETCTSLRDLTMIVVFLPTDFTALGISALTSLESLHLKIAHLPDLATLLIFISDLLWNLPSDYMESIRLNFLLRISDTPPRLVAKPSKPPPALPHLKKLEIAFKLSSDINQGWVVGLLKEQFSAYCERGIMQVEVDTSG